MHKGVKEKNLWSPVSVTTVFQLQGSQAPEKSHKTGQVCFQESRTLCQQVQLVRVTTELDKMCSRDSTMTINMHEHDFVLHLYYIIFFYYRQIIFIVYVTVPIYWLTWNLQPKWRMVSVFNAAYHWINKSHSFALCGYLFVWLHVSTVCVTNCQITRHHNPPWL